MQAALYVVSFYVKVALNRHRRREMLLYNFFIIIVINDKLTNKQENYISSKSIKNLKKNPEKLNNWSNER